ncbi:MAG: class I SAM-dependent methyltransferase [Eudoraea sp.]|nr:class I SAM-dependent methyltransferase [Eudoraea sp.]
MNKNILKTGVQDFINKNINADILSVVLKKPLFTGVTQKELAEQIEAKRKCKTKLPTWFTTPAIYYPKKLQIEQTSSETTAQYKARLVSGKYLLDLTGGLGIDAYYFSQKVAQIHHCEWDQKLHEIASYNFEVLGVRNIHTFHTDGLLFLEDTNVNYDWIYLDPARRDEQKKKVFRLSDCTPDITKHLDLLFTKSTNILLKTAPLLDLSAGVSDLKHVREIHIVATNNEVKEVLWVLNSSKQEFPITVKTINITASGSETFNFYLSDEKESKAGYAAPKDILYEPNAAIMKSGGFKSVAKAYGVSKLHEHSHLYTSSSPLEFPGRTFKIVNTVPFNKKAINSLSLSKANITTRNFPFSVAEIRQRFKIKDGGNVYLFFTTDFNDERIVLVCEKY